MSRVTFGCAATNYLSKIFARRTHPRDVSSMVASKVEPFKSVTIFYKAVEVFCCLDFGYFKYKSVKNRIIWKSFTIFRAICIITAFFHLINYGKDTSLLWINFQVSHYFLTVLILVCCNPNKTFCRLHSDLAFIDHTYSIDVTTYKIEKKIIFWNVFVVGSNIGENYILCNNNNSTCAYMFVVPRMIFTSCFAFLNVVYVSKSFFFYCLTCRLNCLLSMLKSENVDLNSMQTFYKNIVDIAESYKAAFDPLFLLAIVFKTTEYMGYFFFIVWQIIEQKVPSESFVVLVISGMISFFAPALFAEWTSSMPEKLKFVLQDKLLNEKDVRRQWQLKRFLWYVEARGLRFRVYKLIPLDANLFTTVLKFIVTYVIVIVQFIYK